MRIYILLLLLAGPLCLHAQPLPLTLGFRVGSSSWEWEAHRDQLLYDQILAVETDNFSRKYVAKLNREIPVEVRLNMDPGSVFFEDGILRHLQLSLLGSSTYGSEDGVPATWVQALHRLLVSYYGPPDSIAYNASADYDPLLAYSTQGFHRPPDNLSLWRKQEFEVAFEYSHLYPEANKHSYAHLEFRLPNYNNVVFRQMAEIRRNARAPELVRIEVSAPYFETIPFPQREGREDKMVYSEVQAMIGTTTLAAFGERPGNGASIRSATVDIVYNDSSGHELLRIADCTIQPDQAITSLLGLGWDGKRHVCGSTYVSTHPQAQPIERAAASGAYIRHEVYVQKVILGNGTVITR